MNMLPAASTSATTQPAQHTAEASFTLSHEEYRALEGAADFNIAVAGSALLLLGASVVLLIQRNLPDNTSAPDVLRALAVPMIITIAAALTILGYGREQIAPAMGLLGTVVGLLLGAPPATPPRPPREPAPQPPKPNTT